MCILEYYHTPLLAGGQCGATLGQQLGLTLGRKLQSGQYSVWAVRRLTKTSSREMSARSYALHSVCPQLSFSFFITPNASVSTVASRLAPAHCVDSRERVIRTER